MVTLCVLTNCDTKKSESNLNNHMIVYGYDSRSQDYMDTIEVSLKSIDSTSYSYKHKAPDKTEWSFEFDILLNDSVIVLPEGSLQRDNVSLICVDSKQVKLYYNDKKYHIIYKILHFSPAIDSQGLFFWSPEYGLILEKSLTWRTFVRFEYVNNEANNQVIRHLCYSIMHDKDFYNLPNWEEQYVLK